MKRHTGVLCAVLFSVLWGGCGQAPRPGSESDANPETAIPKPERVKVHKICEVDQDKIEVHKGQQVVYENALKDCEVWITTAGPDPYGRRLNDPISPGSSTDPLTVHSNPGTYTVDVTCCPSTSATTGMSADSPDGGDDKPRMMPTATFVIVKPH